MVVLLTCLSLPAQSPLSLPSALAGAYCRYRLEHCLFSVSPPSFRSACDSDPWRACPFSHPPLYGCYPLCFRLPSGPSYIIRSLCPPLGLRCGLTETFPRVRPLRYSLGLFPLSLALFLWISPLDLNSGSWLASRILSGSPVVTGHPCRFLVACHGSSLSGQVAVLFRPSWLVPLLICVVYNSSGLCALRPGLNPPTEHLSASQLSDQVRYGAFSNPSESCISILAYPPNSVKCFCAVLTRIRRNAGSFVRVLLSTSQVAATHTPPSAN